MNYFVFTSIDLGATMSSEAINVGFVRDTIFFK
jgi:hypothetical protein